MTKPSVYFMRKTLGDDFNELALRIKKGDGKAGEKVFDTFAPPFFRFFVQRTGIRAVAEDLVQDVFVKLVRRIDTFDPALGNFTPWFWQIARNALNDYFRQKKTFSLSEIDEEQGETIAIDDSLDNKGLVAEIMDKVREFSEEEQELFSLRYVQGLSYREIAGITGKTEVSLRVAAHRIVKKLKEFYQ